MSLEPNRPHDRECNHTDARLSSGDSPRDACSEEHAGGDEKLMQYGVQSRAGRDRTRVYTKKEAIVYNKEESGDLEPPTKIAKSLPQTEGPDESLISRPPPPRELEDMKVGCHSDEDPHPSKQTSGALATVGRIMERQKATAVEKKDRPGH